MTNDMFDNRAADGDHEDSHLSLETLSAFIDGELSADERSSAGAHLSTCQKCQDELQSLRATTTLMRSLPEIRPARSFQLGPEYAEQARGAAGSNWLSRMLELMPALRAATAAVALLLVVVVAGDVLTNTDGGNQAQEQSAVTTNSTSTTLAQGFAPTVAIPTNTPSDTIMMESEAPTEPASQSDNAAPAGAAAEKESTEASEESAAQEDTQVSAAQAEDSGEADESRAAEPESTENPAPSLGAPAPTETVTSSPTVEPTATATAVPTSTATPVPSKASGTSNGDVSNWRIAEIALGLLLAWLIVTLVGLRRFRRD
jgi:hypothetical protein